jgi:hypothetical protein
MRSLANLIAAVAATLLTACATVNPDPGTTALAIAGSNHAAAAHPAPMARVRNIPSAQRPRL